MGLSNINKSFDDDGSSELLFTHGGYTSNVSDFDWNNDAEFYVFPLVMKYYSILGND